MAELKTQKNDGNVEAFLHSVEHKQRREDSLKMLEIMREETGMEPAMWGSAIVGFGSLHYKYASGREGEWMQVGFAPRKQSLTLYIMDGFSEYEALLARLGKHSTGKSCLYIKKLADVDEAVLRELIRLSMGQTSSDT